MLGVDKNCQLSDVKKAYRKLALKYHPDRVPKEKKEESTVKFREVSEAYEVLSDENSRKEYDRSLRYGRSGASGNGGRYQSHGGFNRHRQHRDPFSQFNDLFRNDPFFSEAFKDMDDLFSKTFQRESNNANRKPKQEQGWGGWLMDRLGIELQTSVT